MPRRGNPLKTLYGVEFQDCELAESLPLGSFGRAHGKSCTDEKCGESSLVKGWIANAFRKKSGRHDWNAPVAGSLPSRFILFDKKIVMQPKEFRYQVFPSN